MKTVESPLDTATRRSLIKGLAFAGGALASSSLAATVMAEQTSAKAAKPSKPDPKASDLAILNFALGLERLELAFYTQVLGAHEERPYLKGRMPDIIKEIAANESAHVQSLEQSVVTGGGSPAPALTYKFPGTVFVSAVSLPWFAYTLEEIGIGAYLGALGKIQNEATRRVVASIYGSETRHAALLRGLNGWEFAPRYFESPFTMEQVRNLIAPYIG